MNNPLSTYRRVQRDLRRHYHAFTQENCPTCPTPCCRQPARILPTDILLAEATGWKTRVKLVSIEGEGGYSEQGTDAVTEMATRTLNALANPPATAEDETGDALPCEFLGETGCSFPADLRPFGCTTYICKYMYTKMDRQTLTRVKRSVRELEEAHRSLLRNR